MVMRWDGMKIEMRIQSAVGRTAAILQPRSKQTEDSGRRVAR